MQRAGSVAWQSRCNCSPVAGLCVNRASMRSLAKPVPVHGVSGLALCIMVTM